MDCVQQSADLFYEKGYCVTDEPGFYKDGEFGIRIENALYVTDVETKYNLPEGTKFLKVNNNLYSFFFNELLVRVFMLRPHVQEAY